MCSHSLHIYHCLLSNIHSPYGHRCKSLHDPRVVICPLVDDNIVVLEHCTKAKRNGDTIPDPLYHRYVNSIRQVNALVPQYLWEDRRAAASSSSATANDTTKDQIEFQDTYNLVCNSGPAVHVFPKSVGSSIRPVQQPSLRARARGGGNSYSDIVNKNNPPKLVMEELHKLSIVILMRTDDTHLDFVYAPTDCEYIQC